MNTGLHSYERAALTTETERLVRQSAKVVAVGAEAQAREARDAAMDRVGASSSLAGERTWSEALSLLDACASGAAQSAQILRRLRTLIASGESRSEPCVSLLKAAEDVEAQTRFAMARGALTCTAELASALRRRAAFGASASPSPAAFSATLRDELSRIFAAPEWAGLVAYKRAVELLERGA